MALSLWEQDTPFYLPHYKYATVWLPPDMPSFFTTVLFPEQCQEKFHIGMEEFCHNTVAAMPPLRSVCAALPAGFGQESKG
jgi:hypothetical protein